MQKFRFTICAALLFGIAASANAQTADMAATISEEQYEGTARSIALGNAFSSLGGDLGAVGLNPAGSAVLRHSEASFTPSVNVAYGDVDYLDAQSKGSATGFSFSNAGFVWNIDTGRYSGPLNVSIGIVYNRKNNFNSYMTAEGDTYETSMLSSMAENLSYYGTDYEDLEESSGYDPFNNANLKWSEILAWNTYLLSTVSPLIDDEYISSTENMEGSMIYIPDYLHQKFNRHRYGGNNEFTLNVGTNISDLLFLGLNLNFTSVSCITEETYSESSYNPSEFQDGFVNMTNAYWQRTAGAGFGIKFGAIVTPLPGLRLAATVSTPTWYNLTDTWDESMTSEFNNGKQFVKNSPTGTYSYKLTSPFRFGLGASYVFGERGLLSFDYERVDYSSAKMSPKGTSIASEIDYQNAILKETYYASNIFRAGGELWFLKNFALRAGFTSYGQYNDALKTQNYISGGLGWRISRLSSLDFTYQHKMKTSSNFTLYEYENPLCILSAPEGTVTNSGSRFYLTYTIRF